MALTDESNGLVMPVSPMCNGGMGGNGFGCDGSWLILFILLVCGGMWGGNGFGGFGGADGMYPWLANGQSGINANISSGFRDNMLNDGIVGIRDGINSLTNQLTNGFASVEQGANARQIANMQTMFGQQTALTQGLFDISSQLANCCCENRLATANLGSDIARESCATRTNDTQNTQAILNAVNDGIRSIHDQLCSDKIDAKNEKIADLQSQLQMAELKANNNLQTQTLLADNLAQTGNLERYLAPTPIPSYIVQNPNCCGQNYGYCGCGCGQ